MQKIARPNESALLESILTQASKDNLEVENIKVPFTYKNNAIYLGDHKIFDIVKQEDKEIDFKSTNEKYDNDQLFDHFFSIIKDLKEGSVEEVEVPVTIDDIDTFLDSDVDGSGKEYTRFKAEKYKVFYSDSDIEISKLLKQQELNKIDREVDAFINKEHKPKYLGKVY
jgi:hypothetical protein